MSEGFKSVHGPVAAGQGFRFGDELKIFDPDAVIADLVIARLVGHDHARL